jgi:hypothetical protein
LGLIFLLASCEDTSELKDSHELSQNCSHCKSTFWIKGYSRKHLDGDLLQSEIIADEMIYRMRKGKVIEFSSYSELYITQLTLSQSLKTKIVAFDEDEFRSLVDFGDKSVSENTNQINNELLGYQLSQIIVDSLTIRFIPLFYNSHPIMLTSNHANLLTDSMLIKMENNVHLKAKQCELSSDMAIWSNKYQGMYFSQPFIWNKKRFTRPAFFQISNTGKCHKLRLAKPIEYIDKLDIIENKMLDLMPIKMRLLFGILTQSPSMNTLSFD